MCYTNYVVKRGTLTCNTGKYNQHLNDMGNSDSKISTPSQWALSCIIGTLLPYLKHIYIPTIKWSKTAINYSRPHWFRCCYISIYGSCYIDMTITVWHQNHFKHIAEIMVWLQLCFKTWWTCSEYGKRVQVTALHCGLFPTKKDDWWMNFSAGLQTLTATVCIKKC